MFKTVIIKKIMDSSGAELGFKKKDNLNSSVLLNCRKVAGM